MAHAPSILSTSGAGASLEARVAGTYLSAMLVQSSGPGSDQAWMIERVEFQRTDPAEGFDDLHLHLRLPTGSTTTAYLQVKRTLRGKRSEDAFRRPVCDAARLLASGEPIGTTFRIVASESALSPRDVDRARSAARLSGNGTDFWSRWETPGASSDTERDYTNAVRWAIEQDLGREDADLAWKVIGHMGLVVLDVDQDGSQAIARAVDQLQGAIASGSRAEAFSLFESICQFAEDAAKVAGGVDRASLIAALSPRYRFSAAPSARACVERLATEARVALASIRNDIAGIGLARDDLAERLGADLQQARGIRLGGEAGTGKSAILRRVAEQRREAGAGLLVLKHDRLAATGWMAHAQSLHIATPLAQLVGELAAGGSALLVLDGLDRMMDAGFGGLVREVCDTIQASATAPLWRCVLSSRDASGLDPFLELPLVSECRHFAVGAPDPKDLARLAEAFPHLAPLLARRGYADLNRNLFFIDQMARNPSDAGASSELDLMRAWAGRGGTEMPPHPSRDATLRALGERRLVRPYKPLPKAGGDDGLARLASERTVAIPAYRDVVTFTHDIYEDWAVARALDARRDEIPTILLEAGQPLAWMRAVRLVAEIALETDGPSGWHAFHGVLLDEGRLDPVWRRLTLTAMLHSPRAANALDLLEPLLLENGARLMGDLIETLVSLEVRPHPVVLHEPGYDHLAPAARRRLAHAVALPRLAPWHAFLTWSARRWRDWPKALVPSLGRVTQVWLRVPGRGLGPTGTMVAQCLAWLRELDAIHAMPSSRWEERWRLLAEMGAARSGSADPVRDLLRDVVATGAAEAIAEIDTYLGSLVASGDRSGEAFVSAPGAIPAVLPARYVDLVVATMVMRYDPDGPLPYGVEQCDGLQDAHGFFPASPTRGGFDVLFATDEDQALRLMAALSGAAAAVWRRRQAFRGLTPRPFVLDIGGTRAELWGDQHVFKWVRGILGPKSLGSLFLAADGWMADQTKAGRPIGELCAKVLGASHLVASASLCLAAAADRATSTEALREVLPLLAEPKLWAYDLHLTRDDRSGIAFQMGWRPGDERAYRAAAAIRERRAGQLPLVHGLVIPLHMVGDPSLRESFRAEVDAWTIEKIASFDEELENPSARAELGEELEHWRAMADASNWRIEPGPAEGAFNVSYSAPQELSGRGSEARERLEALERSSSLLDWAFGYARAGVARDGHTFEEALPIAKGLDAPDLFEHALDLDPAYSVRAQGVAAVAASVALHGTADLVAAELDWLLSVFRRAAAIDHQASAIHFEGTALRDDPAAYAARGLGALVMRGLVGFEPMRIWLDLAGSPFRDIATAALEPAAALATTRPAASAAALAVSAESMLYGWHPLDRDFDARMKASRSERTRAAIDRAIAAAERNEIATFDFPRPATESFIGGNATNPCVGDPRFQFDPYRASAVWSGLNVAALCRDTELRDVLLGYASDALLWYASFLKFQDDRRSYRATRHMDWESTLGRIAGQLAYLIPADEAVDRLVTPATTIGDGPTRSDVLAHLLDALANAFVEGNRPMDARFEAIWRAASQPLFEQAQSEGDDRHDPDEAPLMAAAFSQYGLPAFPPGWSRAGELRDLLDEWVAHCAHYRFSASALKTLVVQSGKAFVPSPGLAWLGAIMQAHRSTDAEHWRRQIGRPAGEILLHLWSESDKKARRAHVASFRATATQLADRGTSSAAELLSEIALVQADA